MSNRRRGGTPTPSADVEDGGGGGRDGGGNGGSDGGGWSHAISPQPDQLFDSFA